MSSPDTPNHRRLSPGTYRLAFAVAAIGVTLLVWGIHYVSTNAVARSAAVGLGKRIAVDAVILEDHVTRSLDVVTSILRSAGKIEIQGELDEPDGLSAALFNLVADVPIIRSLSLVDDTGRIVASSSRRNIGITLSAADLPTLRAPIESDEVKFGESFALRDLHELNSDRTPVELGFWTAFKKVTIDGREYRWLVAVNLGVFRNLWSEIDADESTAIELIDDRGRPIASHHGTDPARAKLATEGVLEKLGDMRHGSFTIAEPELHIAFQGSSAYPATIVMIGDPVLLRASREESRRSFIGLAAAANALLLALIGVVFLFYRRYEQRSQELFNQSRAIDLHLMVSELDRDGVILRGNAAFFEFNGYAPGELIGQSYTILSTGQASAEVRQAVWERLRSGKPWKGTLRNRRKSGELYWVNVTIVPFLDIWGEPDRLVTLMTDITESVELSEAVAREKQLREELSRMNATLASDANTDPLTGQPNKRAFDLFAEQARTTSAADGRPLSLLMIDIDRFKEINDSEGHAAGDAVLRELSRRWARELRSSDMLARIGGEEFCAVLPGTDAEPARRIAEKLRAIAAALPVEIDPDTMSGRQLEVTVSIGVATATEPATMAVEELRERADTALYAAKNQGRNRVC